MKIAIVENDAEQVVRFIGHIKKYSAESGEDCGVVAFGNGIDFLTDYSGDFDAVFMDIDMPLMDGMTAAEKLREIDENVPIVFVTNLAQYAIKGYKVQALDYLVKPVGYFEVALELKKINSLRKNMAGDFVWLTVSGAMLFVAVVLNAVSVCLFVVSRIQIIADVWFIPVNYPETEGTALSISLAGIVFYLISIAATCVAGFAKKLNAE